MSVKYELETVNCLSCGSSSYKEFIRANDLVSHTGESFTVVSCNNCGLKWTNPRVKAEDIGQFYPENYGPYGIAKATITFGVEGSLLAKNLLVAGFHIPKVDYKGKKVLELGCSTGTFLKKLHEFGADTQGVEFSDFAAKQAREKGLKVHTGTINDFNSDEKYDYVFGWMVMEHVYDPKKDFGLIKDLLKPNGIIAFSIPNIDSLDFYLFKKYWYALQVPTHITHFDRKSITRMLNDVGFKVVLMVDHVTAANYIFSFKHLLNENGITIFNKLIDSIVYKKWALPLRRGLDLLARITNQSGRIVVWAQKIN